MKKLGFLPLILIVAACSSGPQPSTTAAPGHGAISVEVTPNPIKAERGTATNSFRFPFDVIVRETGGHAVNIARVSVRVIGPGRLVLGQEEWGPEEIRATGAPTTVPANGEVRMHFAPARGMVDERLFNGISAELVVQALDETKTETQASTVVTVVAP